MDGHVRYEVSDHVAIVTLDRPASLNAFTDRMEAELIECFHRSDADDAVRAVILTGAGRAFCAGMDLTPGESGGGTFETWRTSPDAPADTQFELPGHALPVRRDGGGRVVLRIFESLKPVIAAVNGHAIGVGITMTLPCDIRILAEDAKVGFPFTRRGLVPESCSSWFLPRVVPMWQAMEWMLTGRVFDAGEALAGGLVRSLHPAGEVLTAALGLADEIARHAAPVSAALTRRLLWQMLTVDHPMTAHEMETHALNLRGISDDAGEGIAAFLHKREPAFTDRVSRHLPPVLPDGRTFTPPGARRD
ncbi:enoyl-CoA hydratase-related protein [Phytohabitans sp. ZYX-F-186]|uniref:Enoyl-CoA hydratase-related protein n=1 Tax=Phytohabitans maris TaxID=3071409 RepID=A0ABU0ZQ25_9ACTN|nr:enoyl-CoA hydratase-related protein [Phytohabitans sp. ZYX-F-186]MDQ7909053.1 enoyl-CoA hydratase-related protein [Phytohabitans sp. ZYX-F-186]